MQIVGKIVTAVVMVILAGSLLPVFFDSISEVDTTLWPQSVQTLWNILPIMGGLGIAIGILMYLIPKVRGL